MFWHISKIKEATITTLSCVLRLVPDRLPGKVRLGRMLLRPCLARRPAVLRDRAECTYILPSYAEPMAQDIFTFGSYGSSAPKDWFGWTASNVSVRGPS